MATESPQQTQERMVDVGRGIELCVQSHGDPAHPTLLLVHGLGMQLVSWPQDFVDDLVGRGFHVVRFDNRDIGRSTRPAVPTPGPVQLLRRRFAPSQYVLADMAQDTANLVDVLELGRVHVVGVSMGGMISQTLAARHPEKVRSLVSIMSNTGHGKSGQPARSTWFRMAQPPSRSRKASIDRNVALFRHIGSPGFPFDEAETRASAERAYDRGHDPNGVTRQLGAIMKSGNRTRELATITTPTLVIHGSDDKMVHASGGRATAAAIPGARFESIAGMGHDLPAGARPRIATMIAEHASAAEEAVA
ncbi:MAG: alpha/beta hydrolase [Solirubrobacteraceae bacterium]|nr:alpha/beta hydrolase [Patulibacter sp.]